MAERQFGPYRLVHQIAVGGMAEIHLAKTGGIAGFEKYVALKMIHPNFSQDEQFIQMLIDEAKITVQLQHVNIAQTFDLGRVGDTFYIIMEYVDGCDLYQLLRRTAEQDDIAPVDIAAFIAKEVATGLDYAHRKRDHAGRPLGIVHRDVSPQNVLLSHAGEVKLVDFGIAKATMRARQTAVGVIKGKYYYMSPEQAWGDRVDRRSDVFSTGILLYEMLTGQMLYLEEDVTRLLGMVRKADIAPPTTLRADIPPQLERIAMHCLQKSPGDRYRTAADLAADLERFLHAYSPVFTAGKLAKYVARVMDVETTPPPEDATRAEGMRSARRITQRVQDAELVRSRSEFTDENSVIFRMQDIARDMASDAGDDAPAARTARSTTRAVGDDFADDRTVVDDRPPAFAREVEPHAPERLLDDDTTDVCEVDAAAHAGTPAAGAMGKSRSAPAAEDTLEPPTVRRDRKLPLSPAAEALAARNPRPAVSHVRPARRSRRTPGGGLPAVPSKLPLAAEPSEPSAPAGSVISSLITEAIDAGVSAGAGPGSVIASQPTDASAEDLPTVEQATAVPRDAFRPTGGALPVPRAPQAQAQVSVSFESQAVAAAHVDALADAYKLGRGSMSPWLWRGVVVAVAISVGVAIGLFLPGGKEIPSVASMEIVSIPPGAHVAVDGKPQSGVTPIVLREVHAGATYRIVITHPGYRVWDRREVIPEGGRAVKVIASLKPVVVTLHVESTPAAAEVFLNGRSVGKTPLTLTELAPSAARIIELRAPGYAPERRQLDWADKTEQLQQFTLHE